MSLTTYTCRSRSCCKKFRAPEPMDYCLDCWPDRYDPEETDTYETRHGAEFKRQRQKALKRDGYECQSCGMSDEEHKRRADMFGGGLHVHHKTATNDGGTHDLDNLVSLCDGCHPDTNGPHP